ncbi:MAG: hypothetical protein AAF639_08830 [Chloroflexota bacterium]
MNTQKQTRRPMMLVILMTLVMALLLTACISEEPVESSAPNVTQADDAGVAKFNMNTASREDFERIPGMSGRMVREFFEYRPYISIQQFRREIGKYVDDAQVADYEQYIFVPVDVNDSDEASLQQIPGVDAAIAADLAASRPYDSMDAFVSKLGEHLSAEEVSLAESYLEQDVE